MKISPRSPCLRGKVKLVFTAEEAQGKPGSQPYLDAMQKEGVEIISAITHKSDFNHKSFFVRAPDKVLIEIIESKPIPDGIWE